MSIYDVLVVGSGGAGCSAAITAKRLGKSVLILTRADFLDSKTSRAQGGIQAPFATGDSPDKLYEDALKAGEYTNEKALTRNLADNAVETINWLIEIGIKFDRTETGELLQRRAAGVSMPRVLSCGDASGNRIMAPLIKRVTEMDISVSTYRVVEDVNNVDGVFEVSTFDPRDQTPHMFRSKSVVLATGGAMPKAKRVGMEYVGDRPAPDSIELAARLGLEVESPELTQYHPTGIILPKALRRRPVPELARSAGATLTNKDGEEFADAMMTRRKLCDAIVDECERGGGIKSDDGRIGVWLNTQRIDEIKGEGFFKEHFATLYGKMIAEGVDPSKEPILVYPIAHYTIGGIKIKPDCATNLPGIFSAGEATWGVHGQDRLMGNSLLEIFVFGRIAGASAATYAAKQEIEKLRA